MSTEKEQLEAEIAKRDARIAELEAPMLEWAELDYTKHTRRSLMCYIGQQNFRITAQEKQIAKLESHIRTDNTETLANALDDAMAEIERLKNDNRLIRCDRYDSAAFELGYPNVLVALKRLEALESQQAASVGGEREAFEAFYLEKAKTLPLPLGNAPHRYSGGQYINDFALFGWMVWSHRAARVGGERAERDVEIERLRAALSTAGGVVLPERMLDIPKCIDYFADGWNDCLEEVARLNPCRAQAVPDDRNPMQPIVFAEDGVIRFKQNRIVRHLLDFATPLGCGLNELARQDFTQDDHMQLAQLIGYSVSGYGDLSYASPESVERADEIAAFMLAAPFAKKESDDE